MTSISATLNRLVSQKAYDTSRTMEAAEFLILSITAISIPLLLRHPQLLVGSTVNFVLIMAAINLTGWRKIVPLIVLPSISALAGGYLFGPFTIFLVYLIPFIWMGNSIFVFAFKSLYVAKRTNYLIVLLIGSVLKAGFLLGMALLLIKFSVIPPVFARAMGMTQLITAMLGGFAVFPANFLYQRYLPKTRCEN